MLFRRGEIWYYDFVVNGERHKASTRLRSKAAARVVEDRARERAALGEPARPRLTLGEVAAKWFVARQEGKKSAATVAVRLEIALRLLGAGTFVDAIEAPDVEDAIQRRRLEPIHAKHNRKSPRGPSNTTVNRDLIDTTLRPMMAYAGEILLQRVKPIPWKALRLAEPKGRDRTFTGAEIAAWRERLLPHHRPVFDFAARYGVRLTEAFFPLANVDVEAGQILLRKRKNGRGHVVRLLPEDRATVAALYSRAAAAELETLWFREMPDGSIRAIQRRGFQSASRVALDALGIADARPVHDLRHHAATTLVRRTGNLAAVQALLGHDNIQSTMRYAHADSDTVFGALCTAYGPSGEKAPETPMKSKGRTVT